MIGAKWPGIKGGRPDAENAGPGAAGTKFFLRAEIADFLGFRG